PARSTRDDSAVPATPVARRLAASLGINLHDCRSTGTRGRICRLDVEEAARRFGVGQSAPAAGATPVVTPSASVDEAPTVVPFTSMRRTIAQRLRASVQTSPHFRVHQEIVLDDLLALRAQINASVPGVKISVNDLIVKGVATALMRVPDVNVQFDEASQSVLRFAHADVAVAVAIDDGLITPIVRSADVKPISQISRELSELITRAKAGRLTPDEFQGGTFSVSNLGMLGVTAFDAIINPPQAAILAVGAGIRRPVVLDSGEIAARTVLEVSLSSDHRVIDGALAATFVGELKAILQSPAQMLV
ncbi:dihydrolipoamide acetyltransferase family protein, partial [Microbacterium sp.]|uniref:dihydrolipoamide acetyltransferase family protein n=1 Tax=Microbacterium sp. TaxID=51671 RepID=UPI003C754823